MQVSPAFENWRGWKCFRVIYSSVINWKEKKWKGKEAVRNGLNPVSLTFTSLKKYSSWFTMSVNEGLNKGFSFQQELINVYLQMHCIILEYWRPL